MLTCKLKESQNNGNDTTTNLIYRKLLVLLIPPIPEIELIEIPL